MALLGLVLVVLSAAPVKAAGPSNSKATSSNAPTIGGTSDTSGTGDVKAERVDVESLKKKYWAKGDQYEMQVVQNRLFSKAERIEVGLFGGFVSADPFLSIKNAGLSLGYHFSEYFAVHLMAWKYFVSESEASVDFKKSAAGAFPDTNEPKTYYGGEFAYSPIYGKLSVMGKVIIYYDFQLMLGAGMTKTESGNDATFHFGLGQQVYLSRAIALKLTYRYMTYSETLLKKSPALLGQKGIDRQNASSTIGVGLSFFL